MADNPDTGRSNYLLPGDAIHVKPGERVVFRAVFDEVADVNWETPMRMTELVRKRMKEIGELLTATPAKEDINEMSEAMMLREAYLEVIGLGAMLKAEIDRQEAIKI